MKRLIMATKRDARRQKGPVIAGLKGVSKSFNGQVVLKNIDLSVFACEKIALTGSNGSGKSTLLKILSGKLKPDQGERKILSGAQMAYFPQEIPSAHLKKTGEELLAQEMGLSSRDFKKEIAFLCRRLDFPAVKLKSPIEVLSGGEKSKLMLMIILNSQADLFLLDEPTNNLDLQGLIILEYFISNHNKSFLLVSHDRKFLDRLVDGVIEMDEGSSSARVCRNICYSDYLQQRRAKEEREREKYELYISKRKKLEDTILKKRQEALKMARGPKRRRDKDKYIVSFKKDRAKKIDSQASSIEKQLTRLRKVNKPRYHLPLNLNFQMAERSGDIVFRLKNMEVRRGQFQLGPITWEVNYADRIVILGPNGQGKSSLLKVLINQQKINKGCVRRGTRVKIGYLPQETDFRPGENALNYFFRTVGSNQSKAYNVLARFGFSEDDTKIQTAKLSSGEKSRLILATLMAQEKNCLLFDEPTNHLDNEALIRLESALNDFPGTVIIVSHDRYLIDQVNIKKTYLMKGGKLNLIGGYHEYEEKLKA